MALLGLLLQMGIVAYLVLGDPFYGKYLYRKLVATSATDPGARSRFYRRILRLEWGLSALTLLTLWLRGQAWGALGLRTSMSADSAIQGAVSGAIIGVVLGLGGSILLAFVSARFRVAMGRQLSTVQAMLPVTAAERWQYAAVSVTAGICEELLFRGLMALTLLELFPALPVPVTVVVLGAAFGLAHWYQGWLGVLTTGVLGAGLAVLYLVTGVLWLAMLLHALTDLRVLGVVLALDRDKARGAAA